MGTLPFKSLGFYKPKRRRCSVIGKDLTKITKELGFVPLPGIGGKNNTKAAWTNDKLHAEVRMTAVKGSEGTSWHQDGDTTSGANMDHVLIVWADRHPTEIKYNGKIYQAKPYEIMAVKNLGCHHRRPPNYEGKRFHFRQRVTTESVFGNS